MLKKSRKPIAAPRKKRPKSVMTKAWATRRAKRTAELERINAAAEKLAPELNQMLYGDTAASGPMGLQALQSPRSDSKPDAIAMLLDQFRSEQLCAFVAEMASIRHMQGPNSHQPIMLSRPQAEAIEEFLVDQGFSPFGRANRMPKAA